MEDLMKQQTVNRIVIYNFKALINYFHEKLNCLDMSNGCRIIVYT